MTTPSRPGPIACLAAGSAISLAAVVADIDVAAVVDGVITVRGITLVALGGVAGYVALRFARAYLAESRAERARLLADVARLTKRVSDLEEQTWWNTLPAAPKEGSVLPFEGRRTS